MVFPLNRVVYLLAWRSRGFFRKEKIWQIRPVPGVVEVPFRGSLILNRWRGNKLGLQMPNPPLPQKLTESPRCWAQEFQSWGSWGGEGRRRRYSAKPFVELERMKWKPLRNVYNIITSSFQMGDLTCFQPWSWTSNPSSGQGCETGVSEGNRPHYAVSALVFVVEVQVWVLEGFAPALSVAAEAAISLFPSALFLHSFFDSQSKSSSLFRTHDSRFKFTFQEGKWYVLKY